ncbi:hypothetical protein HJA82_29120 [Rhizobium bangladeshense]|uniref:hypothetical protein n=1 Tax=Rhizobium bangladeshense TaxID=1138189 RepID=UPI001C8384D2|nr:hypothetical protein [Rhizobium bangladeshense]MBX4911376.1 hypothetical protein [Rhizobium bangladeshense]
MVNRVLLDTNRLKISRPGFDVLTATQAQLLFNSDYNTAAIYMRGTTSTQGNIVTIPFGTTFPARPNVDLWCINTDVLDPNWVMLGQLLEAQHTVPRAGSYIDASWSTSSLQVWSNGGLVATQWAYAVWRF